MTEKYMKEIQYGVKISLKIPSKIKQCSEIELYIGGRRYTEAWKILTNVSIYKVRATWQTILFKQWEDYFRNLLPVDRGEFTDEYSQKYKKII